MNLLEDNDVDAKEAAGNWREFDCFAWFDQPADADNWTIVYTSNRDSGLIDQSNAAAIDKVLRRFKADVRSGAPLPLGGRLRRWLRHPGL